MTTLVWQEHSPDRLGVREWTMCHLAPLLAPPSIVIWIFAILLLPHLSLQEEGHLHPTELSPLTESPESATWAAAEREEGDVGGREVETRTWSQGSSCSLIF